MAHISGFDAGEVIDLAHSVIGPHEPKRAKAQRDSLIRNRVILERLGCIDEAGMIKLRKGNAPTITKGPYAGEIVTGDHIIPRSVCPELDNALYNLEMIPLTLNQRKNAKRRAKDRSRSLARDSIGLSVILEPSLFFYQNVEIPTNSQHLEYRVAAIFPPTSPGVELAEVLHNTVGDFLASLWG
jgi:hypothetical protein